MDEEILKRMKIKGVIRVAIIMGILILTRLVALGSVPVHLTQDEAAVGYSAYSLLKTGRDEWGASWPISFRSVGDYKQPVLIYAVMISEAIFGLNEWAVRLPVALFSMGSVLVFWWILRSEIFKKQREDLAFGAAVVMALSPWLIRPSRMSHDAVIALFFGLCYFGAWLRVVRKPSWGGVWMMFLSGVAAVVSYHSAKVFVPALGLVMGAMFRERLWGWVKGESRRGRMWLSLVVMGVIAGVVVDKFLLGRGAVRGQMTFIGIDYEYTKLLLPLARSEVEKVILLLAFWFKRYIQYLTPSFYLLDGLELTFKNQPGQGVLLGIEGVGLVVGALAVMSGKVGELWREKYLGKAIVAYLLVGFLPASLANNALHPYRTGLVIPMISLLIMVGWVVVVGWVSRGWKWLVIGVFAGGYGLGIGGFWDNYLIHYPVELSEYRQYPWGEVAKYVNGVRGEYTKVVVDPRFGTEGPYTVGVPPYYFLFYGKYDPVKFLERDRSRGDSYDYENLEFRDVNWGESNKAGELYVASPWSFSTESFDRGQIVKEFKFLNGKSGIWVVRGEK